jgi:hypothetical protein
MILAVLFLETRNWACGYKKTRRRCQVPTWLSSNLIKVENVLTLPSGQAKRKLLPRKQLEQNSEIFFAKIWKK